MALDPTYDLTEDRYSRLRELARGAGSPRWLPKSRETLEDLETPKGFPCFSVPRALSGMRAESFRFHDSARSVSDIIFYLYPFRGWGLQEARLSWQAVERAFPQPKRGSLCASHGRGGKWDTKPHLYHRRFVSEFIIFIAAVCFLCRLWGFRHFFQVESLWTMPPINALHLTPPSRSGLHTEQTNQLHRSAGCWGSSRP